MYHYKTLLVLLVFPGMVSAQVVDSPRQPSYMILDGIKAFCEGGRVMISAKINPKAEPYISFKCEEDKYQISFGTTNNNVITGIVFEQFGKLVQ